MARESFETQIEQMKSQIVELRARLDEAMSHPYTAKTRETMEEARRRAAEMGQRVYERKGIAIPIGTVMLLAFTLGAMLIMFPHMGTRTVDSLRDRWRKYTGRD
ncbi:MAG: hypothetical protein M1343_04270 [Chloroflexi bacterium]|nr:hypothetical protein [Chloroflexota bacterium]MCL5264402.1 hypothetical protein [Chloroflexota bacterium]